MSYQPNKRVCRVALPRCCGCTMNQISVALRRGADSEIPSDRGRVSQSLVSLLPSAPFGNTWLRARTRNTFHLCFRVKTRRTEPQAKTRNKRLLVCHRLLVGGLTEVYSSTLGNRGTTSICSFR